MTSSKYTVAFMIKTTLKSLNTCLLNPKNGLTDETNVSYGSPHPHLESHFTP